MAINQLMTLKDLRGSLDKQKIVHKADTSLGQSSTQSSAVDVNIACGIIDAMFDQINRCIQQDRSKIKVNVLTKGVVLGLLGERTKNGMKEYLENMFPDDIKDLLNDIQKELDRRTSKNKLK